MKTDAKKIAALTDLYCDFAAHLLSIPEITVLPGVAIWLSERVLLGLPSYDDYMGAPPTSHNSPDAKAVFHDFSFPDVESETPWLFARQLRNANDRLAALGLPEFPRIAEIRELLPEIQYVNFPD